MKTAGGKPNIMVIFCLGDNGAPLGKKWDDSLNLFTRGQKGMLSERGIRVPFVAVWPGKPPAGPVTATLRLRAETGGPGQIS